MMKKPYWFADLTIDGWRPMLSIDDMIFEQDIWFDTEEECKVFMAKIPAGTVIDG
jgi:hypothetical protein